MDKHYICTTDILYRIYLLSTYKENKWKEFRQSVIELDGYKCTQCGRGQGDVTLQVHHKEYKTNFKAWEYATSDCVTLCKGCHAQIHGIIQPTFGWEYIGEEDLGDLIGTCENKGCGSSIRYSFTIFHKQWGTLEVGTVCCDYLTDSEIASNFKESKLKFEGRKNRFINSKKWIIDELSHKIKQGLFDIEILEVENQFSLKINGKKSKIKHSSLLMAKTKVFEIIEDGQLMNFFKENNYDFDKLKKERKKRKN
ncbi:MAG: HNH endonuclease [Flavipsychrobacter sp.]